MKIQIANHILDIDEPTLYDWIKLGRVPRDAFVWSETLTDGQWKPITELPAVRKLWELDSDSEGIDSDKPAALKNEFKTGQGFLRYPKRLPVVTLILIVLNVAIFLIPARASADCFFPRLESFDPIWGLFLSLNRRRRGILAPTHKHLFACSCVAPFS